jgi:signal transduction histidine kinase
VQDLVTPAEFERIKWSGSTLEESTTADEKAVSMALSELILNALEASNAVVDIIVKLDAEHLTIHVINTGDWIGPRTHLRHHRPFTSTKNAVGIGIEVATRVAKSHEGTVTARNLPNNKVEVLLRLPRNPRFASEP